MESDLFSARVRDTYDLSVKTGTPRFLGFLSESQTADAIEILNNLGANYGFFGGYNGALRQMLCCKPDWCDEPHYPIDSLTFSFRKESGLGHRDFLGSLMALGIKRETIGDILVESGRAVVFAESSICEYIISQTKKVGNTGVDIVYGYNEPLPQQGVKVSMKGTVASARLDCIVGELCNCSRSKALEIIENGSVSINSVCCQKPVKTIISGNIISIKGKGRFEILSAESFTKKGRLVVNYNKFV